MTPEFKMDRFALCDHSMNYKNAELRIYFELADESNFKVEINIPKPTHLQQLLLH